MTATMRFRSATSEAKPCTRGVAPWKTNPGQAEASPPSTKSDADRRLGRESV